MKAIILTAGKATRCGAYAPDGCKALVELNGRPIIEWQIDVLGADPIIVCRGEHASLLARYGQVVTNDAGHGAADALATALAHVTEDVVVAYADTFFTDLPAGTDWVGVAEAAGGRSWDVVRDHFVAYEHVPDGWIAKVAVGLYAFSDPDRVAHICERQVMRSMWSRRECGLGPVLNDYTLWREVPVPSWRDVGTVEAIEAWGAA